jgi:molybdopterin-synthase adenylyltransferase
VGIKIKMNKNIVDYIKKSACPKKLPDNSEHLLISIKSVKSISSKFNKSLKKIEIISLENDIIPMRYARNMNAISSKDQIMLLKAKICIIGLGGLGGFVSEMLARIGIGELILIDGDKFDDTNLNRQALSSEDLLNFPKVRVAEKKLKSINSSVLTRCYENFLNKDNAERLINGADVAVDCLDNLKTRFLLEKACKKNGIPLVSAAVAGTAGQATTIFPEDDGFSKIFGYRKSDIEKGAESYLGCLPFTVNMLASIEVSEVIKIILNKGYLLRNKLLFIELMDNSFDVFKL